MVPNLIPFKRRSIYPTVNFEAIRLVEVHEADLDTHYYKKGNLCSPTVIKKKKRKLVFPIFILE